MDKTHNISVGCLGQKEKKIAGGAGVVAQKKNDTQCETRAVKAQKIQVLCH